MKKIALILSTAVVMLFASAYTIQAIINWKIMSEKAQVKFKMQAHGQELIGSFTGARGSIKFDGNDLTNSSFNCAIEVATIKTGMEQRDDHLQGKGWFNATEFPNITFISSKIEKSDEGYIATGRLSMKGASADQTIPFTFDSPAGSDGATFKGSFTMKRSAFGIGKTDGDISDEVTIMLEIPVSAGN
jgi:polyisoprenoid-binding protein YceI